MWLGERSWTGVSALARGSVPILTHRALPGDGSDWQIRYADPLYRSHCRWSLPATTASLQLTSTSIRPSPELTMPCYSLQAARHSENCLITAESMPFAHGIPFRRSTPSGTISGTDGGRNAGPPDHILLRPVLQTVSPMRVQTGIHPVEKGE